jgi:alkaline phosphatase D
MENSFIFKNDRPWPNSRLKRTAIVGHTTHDSVRLWFRTASPGDYTLLLYPNPPAKREEDAIFAGFRQVPYRELDRLPVQVKKIPFTVADYSTDTTYVLDIDGLTELTEYTYALCGEENGNFRVLMGQDYRYTFRTMPIADRCLSFGFYSCHMPYTQSIFGNTDIVNMEMWECLNQVLERHHEENLRFLIAGGDQIYVDGVDSLDIWKYLNKVMRKERGKIYPSLEEMVSWYRDIYRGYWGFPSVRRIFARFPTYMIWDDHELGDGWGSFKLDPSSRNDELDEIFPMRKKRKLRRRDCFELLERMREAAVQVYTEYQHSHNPPTPAADQFDYAINQGSVALYFLDTRGHRDINRNKNRILGKEQLTRFCLWLKNLDPLQTRYLFLVSSVPLMHMRSIVVNADENAVADWADLQDDLRDAWEHELHDGERKLLVKALFDAAQRGIKISILSGDVHTSAVFRMEHKQSGAVIYQLTSSAITYNKPRLLGWILGKTVPDKGSSRDGYEFERLALYTESNFAMLRIDPTADEVIFQLYGKQKVEHPDGTEEDRPVTHSLMKQKLQF